MFIYAITERVVEAYVGEYASGKSEMAINRALELSAQGRRVTLVDLDTVEPFYTLRPLKEFLEGLGLNLISFSSGDAFGLGETGAMLNPRARWSLYNEGDIILDIGYGVHGAQALNLVEGASESKELQIIAVINSTRPMTNSPERIVEYLQELGRVDAIVANTHLGDETTFEIIMEGNEDIIAVAKQLNIPVAYIAVEERLAAQAAESNKDIPIKSIKRYMPSAMW
ncbi:MAG: hypothetical protein PHD40_04335 [Syntrophomonadaceae bacterium]|nr:hypothetical protein [Syntrophomonadaceae bacterium]